MIKQINKELKYNEILFILLNGEYLSISQIYSFTKQTKSLITLKRLVSEMVRKNLLKKEGKGRSVKYQISNIGRLNFYIDTKKYCEEEVDRRVGSKKFNFSLFEDINEIFEKEEINFLDVETNKYNQKIQNVSNTIHKKELERFIIELSWKSSQIEGNTYTLLDTEKLLKEGIEAKGKSKEDAIMIINHKKAFDFIYNNRKLFENITISKIEEIHKILIEDLNVTNNLRSKPVGILGSKYVPLDNQFQIREALELLCQTINNLKDPYGKALLIILGISYIQPFEDGNKRTSRLLGNAILLAYNLAPLSYRIVNEEKYREATLVFYELNSLVPFKKIFKDQYIFSANNYLL